MTTKQYVFIENKDDCFICTYLLWSALGLVWWETSRRCVVSTGSMPWRLVLMVCGRFVLWLQSFWLKKSKPTGLRDAHHWSSHLRSRPKRGIQLREEIYSTCQLCPCVISRSSPCHTLYHKALDAAYTFHCTNMTNLKLWNATSH